MNAEVRNTPSAMYLRLLSTYVENGEVVPYERRLDV